MNSKIIIYDDNCPLCSAYTNTFVQTGLIDKEGRKNFSTIEPELLAKIDAHRAVNEIPVIDRATNQVWYGIDALLEILQQKIPIAKPIGNIKPVKWILKKMYKFISYNRRVIVASRPQEKGFDCTPDFNIPYRFLFMTVFLVFNTLMLFPLQHYVLSETTFSHNSIQQIQLAHATVVIINISIAAQLHKKDGFEYLGQINMLALLVVLLTIPLIALNKYGAFHSTSFNSFYLGGLAIFAVQEYWRRMKFINFIKNYPVIIAANIICVGSFIGYLIH